jgi:Tfp pilus assembly protein PilN
MENAENKQPEQTSQLDPEQKEESPSLETITSELETLRASIKKRKSETTTLKILFYTGLAVLLFGFIYTNQTLQRAQYHNIESNIDFLQSQVNHTLLLLEQKLDKRVQKIETRMNDVGAPDFHQAIQRMNQALDQLEPQTTSIGILIEKVKRNSNELSQMVQTLPPQEEIVPLPVP